MRNILRKLILLAIFLEGCITSSRVDNVKSISENNKDVYILSILICDYLRSTHGRAFNIDKLVQIDTLKRISNNFEKIELIPKGGYIAVYYKFSSLRENNKIILNNKEYEGINKLRWIEKEKNKLYDGEIQFDYGERFYRIKKIKVKQ